MPNTYDAMSVHAETTFKNYSKRKNSGRGCTSVVLAVLLLRVGWRPRVRRAVLSCRHISAQDLWWGRLWWHLVGQRLGRLRCNAPLAPRPRHAALSLHGAVQTMKLTFQWDMSTAR